MASYPWPGVMYIHDIGVKLLSGSFVTSQSRYKSRFLGEYVFAQFNDIGELLAHAHGFAPQNALFQKSPWPSIY